MSLRTGKAGSRVALVKTTYDHGGGDPLPKFLTVEEVLYLHQRLIRDHGGEYGLRDPGLLESAVAQPAMTAFGRLLHPTIPDQAGAYLFHLVMGHAFLDGNKRIGLHAALVFLTTNGWTVGGTADDWYHLTMGVADGTVKKGAATARLAALIIAP